MFLFVDLFDNLGTLVGVSKKAGLLEADNRIPRVNRILLTDATATIGGSLLGTTTVVSYIECGGGSGGGRAHRRYVDRHGHAVHCGSVRRAADRCGALGGDVARAGGGGRSDDFRGCGDPWDDVCTAFPAFLTLITIPLTFSIANGLACGIISYVIIHVACGRWRQVSWAAYVHCGAVDDSVCLYRRRNLRCQLRERFGQDSARLERSLQAMRIHPGDGSRRRGTGINSMAAGAMRDMKSES